jgi:hypothetical protein
MNLHNKNLGRLRPTEPGKSGIGQRFSFCAIEKEKQTLLLLTKAGRTVWATRK